ncbi:MAG: hypothetical protein U9Q08_04410, partial [Candidatus Omnitrophota bacterium]|nr:hypothetical protein [Candidatus Omnitrophota bacterium]
MKRLVLLVLLGLIMALGTSVNSHLFADEESETTEIDFEVEEIFEIAFYPRDGIDESDENIAYPDGEVEFDDIDPMELGDDGYPIAMVPSEERASSSNEDLSDVGILCVSNNGNGWKLGIHMEDTDLTKDNFVVYVPEFGYYRNIEGTKIPAGYSGT